MQSTNDSTEERELTSKRNYHQEQKCSVIHLKLAHNLEGNKKQTKTRGSVPGLYLTPTRFSLVFLRINWHWQCPSASKSTKAKEIN